MQPTNVGNPSYFHKVVDCQWACPAHTNVPEYIRLIAQGRFTDAYMVNRESNVFPGLLGRTSIAPASRPAAAAVGGQACRPLPLPRGGRSRGEVSTCCPPPKERTANGPRRRRPIADRCQRPDATGLRVTVFGMPRGRRERITPSFRLPEQVLDEEIGYTWTGWTSSTTAVASPAWLDTAARSVFGARRAPCKGSRSPRHDSAQVLSARVRSDPSGTGRWAARLSSARQHGDGLCGRPRLVATA